MESLPEPPCSLILPANSQPLVCFGCWHYRSQKGDRNCGKPSLLTFSFLCLNVGSMPSFSELHFPCHHESRCSGPFCCMLRTGLLKERRSGKPNPKQNRKLDTIGTQIPNIKYHCSALSLFIAPTSFCHFSKKPRLTFCSLPFTHPWLWLCAWLQKGLFVLKCLYIVANEWKANSVTFWTLC